MRKDKTMSLKAGNKAPVFTLDNQNGKKVKLSDYAGQWLVLYFYPKDNTSGCTREACEFTDNLKAFEIINTTVLGVSPDSVKSHQNFIKKHALKIDLLSDPGPQSAGKVRRMAGKKYVRPEVLWGRAQYLPD